MAKVSNAVEKFLNLQPPD